MVMPCFGIIRWCVKSLNCAARVRVALQIGDICDQLNATSATKNAAMLIFKHAIDKGLLKNRSREVSRCAHKR